MSEFYVIELTGAIQSPEELYAAFTDTMYLGESGIPGWDEFYDLLFLRLDGADIDVRVEIADDFLRWPDAMTYVEKLKAALSEECPDKLVFVRLHQ